ncbi:MAG: hypothetical protein HOP11_10805 [Saprospiraceae bacterium]|nr:hypothetical protein [Saprospiraceae bacterium]
MDTIILTGKEAKLFNLCAYIKIEAFYTYFSSAGFEPDEILELTDDMLNQAGITNALDRTLILNRIHKFQLQRKRERVVDWTIIIILGLLFILPTMKCHIFSGFSYGFQNGMDILRNFEDIWKDGMNWGYKIAIITPLFSGLLALFLFMDQFLPGKIENTEDDVSIKNFVGICTLISAAFFLAGNVIIIYSVFFEMPSSKIFSLAPAYYLNLFFIIYIAASLVYDGIEDLSKN